MSSVSEMSMVSICGQNGKPRSAITRVLVCRMRLRSELMEGLRMPVLSMSYRKLKRDTALPGNEVVLIKLLGLGPYLSTGHFE